MLLSLARMPRACTPEEYGRRAKRMPTSLGLFVTSYQATKTLDARPRTSKR
jgi:hypothetical protein